MNTRNVKTWKSWGLGLLVLLMSSQGLLSQLFGHKFLAYGLAYLPALLIFLPNKNAFHWREPSEEISASWGKRGMPISKLLFLLALIGSLISAGLSYATFDSNALPFIYVGYLAVIFWMLTAGNIQRESFSRFIHPYSFILPGLILGGVALFQQAGCFHHLPGSLSMADMKTVFGRWLIRPSSWTGSALHYGILMCAFLGLIAQTAWSRFMKESIISAPLGLFAFWTLLFSIFVVYSFNRSAWFILVFTVGVFSLYLLRVRQFKFCLGLVAVCVILFASTSLWVRAAPSQPIKKPTVQMQTVKPLPEEKPTVSSFVHGNEHEIYRDTAECRPNFVCRFPILKRLMTAASIHAKGNDVRAKRWRQAWDVYVKAPSYGFGGYAGAVGNLTPNLQFHYPNTIFLKAESTWLELLLSVGLWGTVLYFLLLVQLYRAILPEHRILKILFFASGIQMFFYQSIEYLPFMVVLSLYPAYSLYLRSSRESI